MNETGRNAAAPIRELPFLVASIFERAHRPLLPGSHGPLRLFPCYVRRKPRRGLVATYRVEEFFSPVGGRRAPNRLVSLTIEEQALVAGRIRSGAERPPVVVLPSGVLRVEDLGISVGAFPADEGLPALAACCDPTPDGPLFAALQASARALSRDDGWRLISMSFEPVRYKPASRCVIRYRLAMERPRTGGRCSHKDIVIFGKVYPDPNRARRVHAMMKQLYEEAGASWNGEIGGRSFLPRPLGIVDAYGLTMTEDVLSVGLGEPAGDACGDRLTGARTLRHWRAQGGEIAGAALPGAELRATATVLALIHTSTVRPDGGSTRTGSDEADRVRGRAALIEHCAWDRSDDASRLAGQLAERLESVHPNAYRPSHGGFKPSQLLFQGDRVFVVDFDAFGLADPALDVGYFLAYLRPTGLWYGHPHARRWFEDAAGLFVLSYRQAMLRRGVDWAAVDGIVKRARLYEAASLLKIACRRIHRLNSPRDCEFSGILDNIQLCLY